MRSWLPIVLVIVTTALPSAAREGSRARHSRFTLEHALTLASLSEPAWSRDGRRLAFVASHPDTAENTNNQELWLWERGRETARRLTRHPKADFSPTFSPGGDTLAFIGARGAEDAKLAIWMLSLDGGDPWAFGSYDESVTEVQWSPDGRFLAYVKLDTLPRQVREWRRKRWDQVEEDVRLQLPQLWVTEIASGKQRRLTGTDQFVWWVRWSPDSRAIAFLTSPTGKPDDQNRSDIGVVAVDGGPTRRLGVIAATFAWSPDGRWIATASATDRAAFVGKSDVFAIPARGGAPINLTAGFDEDGKMPAWNPTSDTLTFHADQGVTSVVATVAFTERVAAGRERPRVTLATDRDAEAGAPVAAQDGAIAWIQSSATEPSELWVADHPRLDGRPVSAINAAASGLDVGTLRRVSWTSSDGVRVGGLLLRPPGASARGALKTLVQLHGGPYTGRNALAFQTLPLWFAAHGYQVLLPNFRSSGGYGTAFMVRRRADWGGQDWRDVTSGIDSLARAGLVDPARLGIYGRSYGGYLTAWGITQRTFDAACVFAGASDLGALWGQSDIQQYRAWEFEGRPWETSEAWRRASPLTHVANVRTPTLIQVGDNDARVPIAQSQQLYRALLAQGVPVSFVHYPREGHVPREPRHRADMMLRMLAWWDRWVK